MKNSFGSLSEKLIEQWRSLGVGHKILIFHLELSMLFEFSSQAHIIFKILF